MDIKGFLESLSTQTRSAETLRAYRQDLERFDRFLKENELGIEQVKSTTITEFLTYLDKNKGRTTATELAPSTTTRRLSVLSSYFEWLRDASEGTLINPVTRVKRPRVQNKKPRAVNDSLLATLVDGISNARDKAIVLLFLYSGLRLDELRRLNKTTITLRRKKLPDGSLQYFGTGEVDGKGSKKRSFIVGPKAMEAIAAYISQDRMNDDIPALFSSSRKRRLSSRAIQQILSKWCDRLGIPSLHIHQLRHSFATRSINAGMSAAVLQELLGHSSLNTTQRYFTIKSERLSREYFSAMEYVNKFSPV
jgi:integrase/recombinase XerC